MNNDHQDARMILALGESAEHESAFEKRDAGGCREAISVERAYSDRDFGP
jgi:hypothetical protein